MKKFLLATAVLISAGARADVQPGEVFGSFVNVLGHVIAHNINNHNGSWVDENGFDWQGGKVILEDQGNKIILGQLTLDEAGTDAFSLPKCVFGDNKPVSQIRFQVKKSDVSIDTIRVTFQNGKTQIINVDDQYSNGDQSQWFALKGLNERCIQKIRITGQVLDNGGWDGGWGGGPGHGGPGHGGPGHGGPGHNGFGKAPSGSIGFTGPGGVDVTIGIGNGNGNGGNHHPGPGHNGHNDSALIQVVGLKM